MNIQKLFLLSFFYNNHDFLYRIKMNQDVWVLLLFGAEQYLFI